MFDERLLKRLDATPEVQRDGRSAVLRRAVVQYLRQRRRYAIAEGYRAAYGDDQAPTDGLGDDFAGWEDEGAWPAE
jgi:predicted transcriptional regulator